MAGHSKSYASIGGGQIHFRAVAGPGIPLVLLHRTPVSSASFDTVLDFLNGRRGAVALDTPGFGQSFRPIGSPSTEEYALWLIEALDALKLHDFHLAAHHTCEFRLKPARYSDAKPATIPG